MKITWYGHSAFRLDFGGRAVLIDPFFTNNPAFTGNVDAIVSGVSHVLITHGHGDHVGDTLAIAKRTGATVVTNYDLCMWLAGQGLEKFEPMNTGGTTHHPGFSVSLVRADHSAGMVEAGVGFPLGSANGLIVKPEGGPAVYHMGDTDVFSDMQLIAEIHQPKVAMVPIGDRFTMSPATAALAVQRFFKLDTVIPCHYGSFPIIEQTADGFVAAMQGHTTRVLVPERNVAVDI